MPYACRVHYLSPPNQNSKDLELLTCVCFWTSRRFYTNITSRNIVTFVIYFRTTDISIIHQMTLRSILIIIERDATQSSLFIILQVHSTCFGCQPHPSSGVHKTVTIASDTGHIFCADRRLSLQFCVLLMMGVVDTRNI